VADIKKVPEIYRRLQNGDYLNGQRVRTFEVWPTGHPFIVMEKGERLTFPLRVWRNQLDARVANPVSEDMDHKTASAPDAQRPAAGVQQKLPFPTGAINYRIRPGADSRGFWIDIDVSGIDKGGLFEWSANVTDPSTGESFPIELSALIYDQNLIVNPRSLDFGEVSLSVLQKTPIIAAQLNLRKMIGPIHIKAVSSTLAFVKGGVQVLVDGSNYLVKAYVISSPGVDPGKYEGTIRLDTDDPAHARIDVPFKMTVVR